MKTFLLSCCLCVFFITIGTAQDQELLKEVLNKSKMIYETATEYELDLSYTIRRLNDLETIQESYDGVYAKQQNTVYSKIGPVELIYRAGTYLQINHDEKVVMYTTASETALASQNPLNVLNYVDAFAKAKVTKTADGWQCELSSPKQEQRTQMPFDKIILYIDNDYAIRKQIIHPLEAVMFSNIGEQSVLERPVLEITITAPKDFTKNDKMQLDTYVTIQNGLAQPAVALKNYQLIKV